MNAVLTDNRRGQKTVLTPTTTGAIQDWADTGMAANEIVGKLRQRRQTLSPIHQAQKTPTVRTIQMCLKNNGSKFTYKGSKFLVKTPWHARWRKQFCEQWLPLLTAPESEKTMRLEWILFTDEKKFCLWDSNGGGRWIMEGASTNIARNMTDEEYMAWKEMNPVLSRKKQRGRFPCFVWGGVGHNMKTKLHFLDEGQKLTADGYRDILYESLIPFRDRFRKEMKRAERSAVGPRRGTVTKLFRSEGDRSLKPELIITQDNDSKHYNDQTRRILAGAEIRLMASERLSVEGETDKAPGRGGAMKEQRGTYFPCYSPDLNGPIEKVWREVQRRVIRRAIEVEDAAWGEKRQKMIEITTEEWNNLEFEETDDWCGINQLVANVPVAMAECIKEDGFDTSFMNG